MNNVILPPPLYAKCIGKCFTHENRTAVNMKSRILDVDKTYANAVNSHFNRRTNSTSGCKISYTFFYSNVDCWIQAKRVELEVFISENYPYIIGMTEIYPKQYLYEIDQSIFQINNYDLFCSPMRQGRGVIIYVRSALFTNSVTFDTNYKKSVWCRIQLKQANTLLWGYIYRSPICTLENSEHLMSLLRKVCQEKYSHVLIMGDFNYTKR